MDLEGHAKRLYRAGRPRNDIVEEVALLISDVKKTSRTFSLKMAEAIVTEVESSLIIQDSGGVFYYEPSGVSMGNFGVGSRGLGDFYVHRKLSDVIGKTTAVIDSSNMDDSGVVSYSKFNDSEFVVVTVDGIHSRLSSFPFLSGFHAARAALRDIYTMGSRPIAMLSDIHMADDGDVAALFDHVAGISAVGEASGVPLITGSTLRIGGDMVIGDRMSGCVGAVGVLSKNSLTSRKRAVPGDIVIMTQGAGGGTVTTAAIYSGYRHAQTVVDKTINIDFLKACDLLIDSGLILSVHSMTDVTNGGLRGDALEISNEAGVCLIFDDENIQKCIHPDVSAMFEELDIDPLGVSIDSLLIVCPENTGLQILNLFSENNISAYCVGYVESGTGAFLTDGSERYDMSPQFRESAYTPLKKLFGNRNPQNIKTMNEKVDIAAENAILKKNKIVQKILKK